MESVFTPDSLLVHYHTQKISATEASIINNILSLAAERVINGEPYTFNIADVATMEPAVVANVLRARGWNVAISLEGGFTWCTIRGHTAAQAPEQQQRGLLTPADLVRIRRNPSNEAIDDFNKWLVREWITLGGGEVATIKQSQLPMPAFVAAILLREKGWLSEVMWDGSLRVKIK